MASNVLTTVGKVLLANTLDEPTWLLLVGQATKQSDGSTIYWDSNGYDAYQNDEGYQGFDFDIDTNGGITLNSTPVVEFDIGFENYNNIGDLTQVQINTVSVYGSTNSVPDTSKLYLTASLDNAPVTFEGSGKFTLTDFQITIS